MAISSNFGVMLGGHIAAANKSDIGELEKIVNDIQLNAGMTLYEVKVIQARKTEKSLRIKNI